MRINRISNKIQAIDSWARKIGGANFVHLKFGREFDKEKILRAFEFIGKYNLSDDFDRTTLEGGKQEAEALLKRFEQYQNDLKHEEDMKAESRRDLEAKFRENGPHIFQEKIRPHFDELKAQITAIEKEPGFASSVLYMDIKNEIYNLERILKKHAWRKI